ncbi:MAG TPA: serine hydrolase domain-containing protein [Tepidisphaeraceae bacterium]|jgi:CubicO group peptidase (beta-lactamase class C family)|nr:serine hydrolase domain-containing protein [Tepidisphaeraceae bacterium]
MTNLETTNSLPHTTVLLEAQMAQGLHIGAQVFVSRDGKTVADFAIGESKPGIAMTPETLTLWLSACKPVGAIAIAQQLERGKVGIDDPVADFIPEFAAHGKETVSVRHLLTHTAGLRFVETGWPGATWSEVIDRICQTSLEANWIPGERARYDATLSWFILGEIIRRVDGRPFEIYVRDEIFTPMGMADCWIGMPESRCRAYGDRLGVLYMTDKHPIRPLPPYDTQQAITHCRPASNGQGPVRQLARFYQMLLNGGELDGVRLLKPETVSMFTTPKRIGMLDETFRHKIDWGFGFLISSRKYGYKALPYSFGPHASDRAFGHNGFQSSMVFADPEYGLVIAIAPNGTPGEPAHDRRLRAVLGAVYEDVGIAPASGG